MEIIRPCIITINNSKHLHKLNPKYCKEFFKVVSKIGHIYILLN